MLGQLNIARAYQRYLISTCQIVIDMDSFGSGGCGRVGREARPHSKQAQLSSQPRLQVCRNFASTGNCHHGKRCNFSHVIKLYASIEVSDKNKASKQNSSRGYGGNNKLKDNFKVTSVAIWENNGATKLFTGSYDGKWRLWNMSPPGGGRDCATLTKEFEHFVGGPVDTVRLRLWLLIMFMFILSGLFASAY